MNEHIGMSEQSRRSFRRASLGRALGSMSAERASTQGRGVVNSTTIRRRAGGDETKVEATSPMPGGLRGQARPRAATRTLPSPRSPNKGVWQALKASERRSDIPRRASRTCHPNAGRPRLGQYLTNKTARAASEDLGRRFANTTSS